MAVAPSALAHWPAIRPTPPAAACHREYGSGTDPVGAVEEKLDRHALHHPARSGLEGNIVRQAYQRGGINVAPFAIGAGAARIGHAIPLAEIADARTDGNHGPCGLAAGNERQSARRLVEAGAIVDIDEVERDRRMADLHLSRRRRRHVDIGVFEDLRTAVRRMTIALLFISVLASEVGEYLQHEADEIEIDASGDHGPRPPSPAS